MSVTEDKGRKSPCLFVLFTKVLGEMIDYKKIPKLKYERKVLSEFAIMAQKWSKIVLRKSRFLFLCKPSCCA